MLVVPVGESEARRGAEVRIDHYHHRESPLSLAECLVLGTALVKGAVVATSDGPLSQTGDAVGVGTLRLKDSDGLRP